MDQNNTDLFRPKSTSIIQSCQRSNSRMTPVRFGYGLGWNGSSGSGFRFWRFLCKKGFSVFQYSLAGKDGSGSGFGSLKTVPAVPVLLPVSAKNGSDGSGFRFRFSSGAT